ncbi:hypothetical protein, partial [Bacillus sp. AFS073361]|uniref:hypothetical protein n=1 Tax=Bacillus sp. AFS073361 TaxID=2033511 RepID=UPI001C551D9E
KVFQCPRRNGIIFYLLDVHFFSDFAIWYYQSEIHCRVRYHFVCLVFQFALLFDSHFVYPAY